jgi:hypothetical protein
MRVTVTPEQIRSAFEAGKDDPSFDESRALWERGRPPVEMIQAMCLTAGDPARVRRIRRSVLDSYGCVTQLYNPDVAAPVDGVSGHVPRHRSGRDAVRQGG